MVAVASSQTPAAVDYRPACPVDFETYYAKDYSVKNLGAYAYCQDPRFDAYLVSMIIDDVKFVGHPKDAPWHLLEGRLWISHNVSFDRHVYERLVELGIVPAIMREGWEDTANLAAYLRVPRNLAGAARALLGMELDKGARSNMKGRTYGSLNESEKLRLNRYALEDSIACGEIWEKFHRLWPVDERLLADHTVELSFRGVAVDRDKIHEGIRLMKRIKWEAAQEVPWIDDFDEDADTALDEEGDEVPVASHNRIAEHCREIGLPPPSTTAAKSDVFQKWLAQHGEKAKFITQIQRYRRANRILRLLEVMLLRIRPDGRMHFDMRYFGAHTGRWSGGGGINIQNPIKEPFEGFDLRSCFVAGPGKKFIIADLSQIEPRILASMVRDTAMVEAMKSGQSPYEAHARSSMGWTGGNLKEENHKIYALAKARVLALGYQAGWKKFISMASLYVGPKVFAEIFESNPSMSDIFAFRNYLASLKGKQAKEDLAKFDELDTKGRNVWVNSWLQVQDFRKSNPLIASPGGEGNPPAGIWKMLDDLLRESKGGTARIKLPCGYTLEYYGVQDFGAQMSASFERGGRRKPVYGGKLTENAVQCEARFVFGQGILRLEDAGLPVVFHVHDEVVVEVDEDTPKELVVNLLAQAPKWSPHILVAAEAKESKHYQK